MIDGVSIDRLRVRVHISPLIRRLMDVNNLRFTHSHRHIKKMLHTCYCCWQNLKSWSDSRPALGPLLPTGDALPRDAAALSLADTLNPVGSIHPGAAADAVSDF